MVSVRTVWSHWWHGLPALLYLALFGRELFAINGFGELLLVVLPLTAVVAVPVVWGRPTKQELRRRLLAVATVGAATVLVVALLSRSITFGQDVAKTVGATIGLVVLTWLALLVLGALGAAIAYGARRLVDALQGDDAST